jgi:MFS family permease
MQSPFRISHNYYLISTCVFTSLILSMIGFSIWPVYFSKLTAKWMLTDTQVGLISGGYYAGYILATPVLVRSTDIIDSRQVFIVGCLFTLSACLGFSFIASGFWTALIFWGLAGIGLAGTYMPGLQILNSRVNSDERVRIVPFYAAAFTIGTAISFATMSLISVTYEVSTAALIASFSSIISLLIIFFLTSPQKPDNSPEIDRKKLNLGGLFLNRSNIAHTLAYAGHCFELFAYRAWIFALVVFISFDNHALAAEAMGGLILAGITVIGISSSVIGAYLCLSFERHITISNSGIMAFIIVCLTVLFLKQESILAIVLLGAYYFSISFISSSMTAGIVMNSDESSRGALLSVYSMIGFLGAMMGPILVGLALDLSGGSSNITAWKFALFTMSLGSIIVFLVQRWALQKVRS